MGSIPVIDLKDLFIGKGNSLNKLVNQIKDVYSTAGVSYLINHNIPPQLFSAILRLSDEFHQLPNEEKRKIEFNDHFSGYIPNSREITTSNGKGIRKQNQSDSFFYHNKPIICSAKAWKNHPFSGVQQWPNQPQHFKSLLLEYKNALSALCHKLLPVFSMAMGLNPNGLAKFFNDPTIILRLLCYSQAPLDDLYGLNPHVDLGCFTLLLQDNNGGLQAEIDGKWVDVPPVDNSLVLNVGKVLSLWSQEKLKASLHRVINKSGRRRYSIPFFFDCNLDSKLNAFDCTFDNASSDSLGSYSYGQLIEKNLRSMYSFKG